MTLPNSIKALANELEGLPGIGPRQAIRIAIYLAGSHSEKMKKLAETLYGVLDTKTCPDCFRMHDGDADRCAICGDLKRSRTVIAIVEKETDLASIETSGKFNGRYLVIGNIKKAGALEEWQKERIKALKKRIETEIGMADEIIIAMNPTTYGDISSSIVANEIQTHAKRITRLGRGIPFGGEIEFADRDTLGAALENRS
jgi:recombination protein RecR